MRDDEARYELRQGEPGDAPLPRGWGGRRAGAGRPRALRRLRTLSVRLLDEDVARLKAVGDGNASQGVRRLLAAHAS